MSFGRDVWDNWSCANIIWDTVEILMPIFAIAALIGALALIAAIVQLLSECRI
jgi:hypothetical protein